MSQNNSTKGRKPRQGGKLHGTDLRNARRLVARHGQDLRYCHPWGRWLVWDGRLWAVDESGEVMRRAKETVASIYAEASAASNIDKRTSIAKWAVHSESEPRLRAMVSLATSEPGIALRPGDLDADPWLLNCLNGTLNLRTGRLLRHRREDYLTKLVPVEYDPKADCPRWRAFLYRIMAGNEALIRYLQRLIGYSLTGDVSEQVMFFAHGPGANGKSTFSGAVQDMLGPYATQAAPELLVIKSRAHPTELADLAGRRFVATIEVEDGRRLAEALVKQLTGGDRLKGRFMRQDFWEFPPTHKIFLAANHKPVIRGTDYAIWRRVKMIPFDVTIPTAEQDKGLADKLRAELPGILAWAVQGCLDWQRNGLQEPADVVAATAGYRAEMDVLGGFIADCCVVGSDLQATLKAMRTVYTEWCAANGETPLDHRDFKTRLEERGFTQGRTNKVRYWQGIGLAGDVMADKLLDSVTGDRR